MLLKKNQKYFELWKPSTTTINGSGEMARLASVASTKAWVCPRHPWKKLGMEVLVALLHTLYVLPYCTPYNMLDSQTNLIKPHCNPVSETEKGGNVPPTNRPVQRQTEIDTQIPQQQCHTLSTQQTHVTDGCLAMPIFFLPSPAIKNKQW